MSLLVGIQAGWFQSYFSLFALWRCGAFACSAANTVLNDDYVPLGVVRTALDVSGSCVFCAGGFVFAGLMWLRACAKVGVFVLYAYWPSVLVAWWWVFDFMLLVVDYILLIVCVLDKLPKPIIDNFTIQILLFELKFILVKVRVFALVLSLRGIVLPYLWVGLVFGLYAGGLVLWACYLLLMVSCAYDRRFGVARYDVFRLLLLTGTYYVGVLTCVL
eukprot:gene2821-1806_t